MQALVSILIPAFNAEAFIAETLESAVGQTWPRKEIIVVDDGSTDGTLSEARRFEARGVTVLTQSNQGAAAARNRAYAAARGDYIQWLDADDLLAHDKIAKQLEVVGEQSAPKTLLSSAWGHFIYRPATARFIPSLLWNDLSPVDWMILKFKHGSFMQTATWLVSRELSEKAGAWDTRLLGDDDGEYFCRVLLASDSVRFVPDAKVLYRVPTSNSLSHIGRSDRKMEAHLLSMKLHIDYLRQMEDSARVREACIGYLQVWLIYFHPERPDLVDECRRLAAKLGGQLQPPRLSWKYSWIQKLFGWGAAKRAQLSYNHGKAAVLRSWDKALLRWERRSAPHPCA